MVQCTQKLPNTSAGEARTVAHQAWDDFPPVWTFNGMTPGPLIVERYGVLGQPEDGSVLLRIRNNLPANNGGFSLSTSSTARSIPCLHVSPRRYRFRRLNTGPSRFYQMFVLGPNNSTKSFGRFRPTAT